MPGVIGPHVHGDEVRVPDPESTGDVVDAVGPGRGPYPGQMRGAVSATGRAKVTMIGMPTPAVRPATGLEIFTYQRGVVCEGGLAG